MDMDDRMSRVFWKIKKPAFSKPVLRLFDPQAPCHVFVDAVGEGIGAVLKQPGTDGTLHPMAFHSRTLEFLIK